MDEHKEEEAVASRAAETLHVQRRRALYWAASLPKWNFLPHCLPLVETEVGSRLGRGLRGELPSCMGWLVGGCSLNHLTFTACCGIKPGGQDRTLTRLSRG